LIEKVIPEPKLVRKDDDKNGKEREKLMSLGLITAIGNHNNQSYFLDDLN